MTTVAISYWPADTSEPVLETTVGGVLRAAAAAIDAEGWYHTGDLASLDGRGYLRIEGRIKDMIIRGGENIYPRESFSPEQPSA